MDELKRKALAAFQNSYSPYSKFKVGAAILLKNGEIILGTNIENASYGLSNCAERSALFATYSQGYRKEDIIGMVVTGDVSKPISPCGACRQVMSELMPHDAKIILTNLNNEEKEVTITDLLPYGFTEEDLHE